MADASAPGSSPDRRPSERPRRLTLAIVIPVRNDRAFLERCLVSIEHQTVPPDEVIVVDNGDDDLTDLARKYGCRIVREPVVGIPAASARGLDAATADVLARIDADSQLPPGWVEAARERFADADVQAVTGWAWLTDRPPIVSRLSLWWYLGGYTVLGAIGLGHRPLWGSAALLRREVWLAAREHVCRDDQRVHDDLDLSFHLPPGTRVLRDRRLSVGVADRAFHDPVKWCGYTSRGVYTFVRHWPRELPPLRYARIIRARHPIWCAGGGCAFAHRLRDRGGPTP